MMKVSELEGARLDYWVGKADGQVVFIKKGKCINENWLLFGLAGAAKSVGEGDTILGVLYEPSADWSQGGPIIERERIAVFPSHSFVGTIFTRGKGPFDASWTADNIDASDRHNEKIRGPTALIAAMRCLVASKFGNEIPDDLMIEDVKDE